MATGAALKLEIKGLKELQAKTIQMIRDLHGDEIASAMRDTVFKLQRRVMQGPSGGRSGPGTTPVGYIPVDTGRLRASITPQIATHGPTLRGVVGTNTEYGPYHEFGTKRGVRALKYFRTTLDETREWIMARFDRAMARIVKKRPK